METIKNIKKGEYFKLKETSNIVYIKGDYDRSQKKYECTKFDDINDYRYFKADKSVVVDFEF